MRVRQALILVGGKGARLGALTAHTPKPLIEIAPGLRFLDVLLEPRTLARGQLREEGVRRLVDETLAGRLCDTRAVGMLVTFELFQRQFIDGEQPA